MNTRTYILSGAQGGDSIFQGGRTTLHFSFSGIEDVNSKYLKFIVDYDDGSDLEIIQPSTISTTTNISDLSAQTASHIFNPSTQHITSYTVGFSGIKTDLTLDKYEVAVKIGKSSLAAYKDVKVINSYLYTSVDGVNNLLLTIEAQNPRFVGNVIIPYTKDLSVYLPRPKVTPPIDPGIFLRSELYSSVGPFQTLILERHGARTSWGHVIREPDLKIPSIGTEDGTSILVGEEATEYEPNAILLDINGVPVEPTLIMIPEFSYEFPIISGLNYRPAENY